MNKDTARTLVEKTLHNEFDKERFCRFIRELLNRYEEKPFVYKGKYIREAYAPYIQSLERIGSYQDSDGKKIDILIAKLKKGSSLERARTMQRNFIAWYLTSRDPKDAALVAFVSPDPEDWRFSLVKMEYKIGETPTGRVKAVAEYTPARRLSFLVGTHETSHTAQSRLVPIIENDEHDPTLAEIEDAFNIEKATKEFFEKYRDLFHQVNEALDTIIKKDASIQKDFKSKNIDTVDFAKKLLGQIVFLYFLQKKGWFGVKRKQEWGSGSKHFLRELFEKKHSDYKNFFNDILEPLFYEALRLEHPGDYFHEFDCRIPFLNGGLFDPINDYDWVETDILIPNELFSNSTLTKEKDKGTGILDIFDRYNFTVKEDEPLEKEVAVDPEMLGKVFENLLEVKNRKSKGTYYTPREIVHYMCQESLINYLATELEGKAEKEDIETLVKFSESFVEHDSRVIEKGHETQTYSFKLPESIRDNAKLIDEKLASIRVCDPAVGSGAFPVGMMNEIVRARNSLTPYMGENGKRTSYHFKRHAIQECLYGVDIDSSSVEIAKLRLWLSLVVDEEDRKTIQPLPNLDYKIVCGNSLLGVKKDLFNLALFEQLEELKPQYFDETNPGKKKKYKSRIDDLIAQITNGHKDFDFEVYFSEVFHDKEGFDVVIANPPYDEVSSKQDKNMFKRLYNDVLAGHYDLYIFFFKRAFEIAKRRGIISFITPHTYVHYPQFINIRKYIYEHGCILEITNRISGIFETAVVDNSIILIQKNKETDCITKFSSKLIASGSLNNTDVFLMNKKEFDYTNFDVKAIKNKEIFNRYVDDTESLGDITQSSQGITVYAKVQGEKINWFRSNKVDEDSRPIIRGRDINRYYLKWTGRYIQYGNWLWCPRKIIYFEGDKIFLRQTADSLIGTYWKEPMYCLDSVHSIISLQEDKHYNLRYILAILNSSLGNFLYKLLITETGKVFAQVKLTFLRQIPIKKATVTQQNSIISIVDKILAITKEEDYLVDFLKQDKVHNYKKQIDQLIYKLYGLTSEEIKIVEEEK